MSKEWVRLQGVLRKGYGVASGHSQQYPYGSLERQIPIFRARGLDLAGCFLGTLNIDIRPLVFELVKPEFTFRDVHWTDLHPAEHFSLSRCRVAHESTEREGWIYYPHPETKQRHFQESSLMEIIAPYLASLQVGQQLWVTVDPSRVAIESAGDR